MKVLKLAYISHGWVLCFTDQALITERVEAWRYGPVVPSLYHYLKPFKASAVPSSQIGVLPSISGDERLMVVLDSVWAAYRHFSGIQLSAMTHEIGTPWYATWHGAGCKDSGCESIDNLLIRDHYKSLLRHRQPAAGAAG